jgi:homoserine kinase type II
MSPISLSEDQLLQYLVMFRTGEFKSFGPISAVSENTNYFVETSDYGEDVSYVLTIFQSVDLGDLPFFTQLMTHLHQNGLPVPVPKETLDGMTTTLLRGKPTALFSRLAGTHIDQVEPLHCHAIGRTIAEMHAAGFAGKLTREYEYDDTWLEAYLAEVRSEIADEDRKLLDSSMEGYNRLSGASKERLPTGIIHGAPLVRNTLFDDGNLTGLLDFYQAGTTYLIVDLAVMVNEWCLAEDGSIQPRHLESALRGYEQARSLTEHERSCLPRFLELATIQRHLARHKKDGTPIRLNECESANLRHAWDDQIQQVEL